MPPSWYLIHFATDLIGSEQQLTTKPLIAGRPVEWLALQALAALSTAATGFLLASWRSAAATSRIWTGLLASAVFISILWACRTKEFLRALSASGSIV